MMRTINIVRKEEKIIMLGMKNDRVDFISIQCEQKLAIGNIYIGKIKSILNNIQAAFVEVADQKKCYLSLNNLGTPVLLNRIFDGTLKESDELLVQVVKEPIKSKEATVSTEISLAGRYCIVLNTKGMIGFSKKLSKEEKRELHQFVTQLIQDSSFGVVIRTNIKELCNKEEKEQIIEEELTRLISKFQRILKVKDTRPIYSCLECALPEYLQRLRDVVGEKAIIRTDDYVIFHTLKAYMDSECFITNEPTIQLYEDEYPFSKLISLEKHLSNALDKKVWLKSGGSIVIEPTEALTAIDVNSGKYTGKKSKKDTIYKMNVEAAIEIIRQLKIRNISGIIIVDFMKMVDHSQEEDLLQVLRKEARKDTIPTTVVGITTLGLVEITRKKIRASLQEEWRKG